MSRFYEKPAEKPRDAQLGDVLTCIESCRRTVTTEPDRNVCQSFKTADVTGCQLCCYEALYASEWRHEELLPACLKMCDTQQDWYQMKATFDVWKGHAPATTGAPWQATGRTSPVTGRTSPAADASVPPTDVPDVADVTSQPGETLEPVTVLTLQQQMTEMAQQMLEPG